MVPHMLALLSLSFSSSTLSNELEAVLVFRSSLAMILSLIVRPDKIRFRPHLGPRLGRQHSLMIILDMPLNSSGAANYQGG